MLLNRIWPLFPYAKHGIRQVFLTNFNATSGVFSFASIAHQQSKEDGLKFKNILTSETPQLSAFIDELLSQPFQPSSNEKITEGNFPRKLAKAQDYWTLLKFDAQSTLKVGKFSKDLAMMDIDSLVFLLIYFGNNKICHEQILKPLFERIKEFTPLNNKFYITSILKSLLKLDWIDAELITKLKLEVLKFRDEPYVLENALFSLARLHLTDRYFWRQIIELIEPVLETKQISDSFLLHIGQAFALANIDNHLIASFGQALIKRIRKDKTNLFQWLEFAYILTCFNCLTDSIAESVLNKNFIAQINRRGEPNFDNSEKLIAYDNMRLKVISCAAKLELQNYKGPLFVNKLTPKLLLNVLRSKFNENELLILSNFELLMRVTIPLNIYSTGREWHEQTGIIIEGRCFVDVSKKEFVPLNRIENNDFNEETCKEVAILFFTKRQITRIFDKINEIGPVRLVGICQTGIRLLKKAGLHPVVFTEEQFELLNDERSKVEFIRNRLLNLSDDFHENNWILDEKEEEINK